ncbi:NAD(P)/FAD-dependent oxidoreductase [Streptomyces sp. BI20]|uniref:NAD(P)/FAD-dependent oxidoreductase n=1 Tax=Streptomyces sp. BI20 TaxID=3403460 RepID=UPI003C767F74
MSPTPAPDLLIIGAGVVGAACAFAASRAGLRVTVVDRGFPAGGTTGAGEGNLLVSDKGPGPELDLALHSTRLWRAWAPLLDPDVEYEAKGGLVVAERPADLAALLAFAAAQRAAGVTADEVPGDELRRHEPHLAPGLPGGVHYPQDAQLHPARAAARLLAASGARLLTGHEVHEITRAADGRVTGVRTTGGRLAAGAVLNAAGTWAGEVARMAGGHLPVLPRRGFVLVTEPLPRVVRHKVYSAGYVSDVAGDGPELQSSAVVEGTPAGPVLIGATRERVGFDRRPSPEALGLLAAQATALFPVLGRVRALRAYHGFRPYLPDHLPAIGPDPRVPGLLHACGHEGAGIGLAPGTAALVLAHLTGTPTPDPALSEVGDPPVAPAPFLPARFDPPPAGAAAPSVPHAQEARR